MSQTTINDAKAMCGHVATQIAQLSVEEREDGFELQKVLPIDWRGEDRAPVARGLLRIVGIIRTRQGTTLVQEMGGRTDTSFEFLMGQAEVLLAKLEAEPTATLSRARCEEAVAEGAYPSVATILKALQLASSNSGRAGGLKKEGAEAILGPATIPLDPLPPEKEKELESRYYAAAEAFLSSELDGVSGVRITASARRTGSWSNPDVSGWALKPCEALARTELRVATIEVKLRLERHGIAEARAHQRFSHNAWLLVPVTRSRLETELRDLVQECAEAGVGLACFRHSDSTTFNTYLPPRFCRPDPVEVNELLMAAFESAEIAHQVRRADASIVAKQ